MSDCKKKEYAKPCLVFPFLITKLKSHFCFSFKLLTVLTIVG